MIKKKLLTLSLALTLTSCSNYGTKPTTINPSIMCPTGGPAVALSCMASSKKFETTSDPSLLMGYFGAENYDVIVAPTDEMSIYIGAPFNFFAFAVILPFATSTFTPNASKDFIC